MGTRYNITITATDAATARIRAIKQALGQTVLPITQIGRSVKALGKEVGVDKIIGGMTRLSKAAAGVAQNIGGIGGAIAGATLLGSVGALANFTDKWLRAGSATLRFSQITGVAASQLEDLRGAAKLAGLQAEDMDSTIQSLGETMQDAKMGRNQPALFMAKRLGLTFKTTKDGAIDSVAALKELANALQTLKVPVQTKAQLARIFGAEALLPMLLKGGANIDQLAAKAHKLRPPISDEDRKKMDETRAKVDALGLSFENLGNTIELTAMPAMGGFIDMLAKHNDRVSANLKKEGFWGALGAGVGSIAKGTVTGIGKAETWAVKKALGSVQDIGRLIGAGEGGYNSVNLGKRGGYKAARTNLVESSVGSVMQAQARGDFNAAGKYQMIPSTLAAAVKSMGLDKNAKFDEALQERIFKEYLLRTKRPEIGNYISGKSDDLHAALKAASKEWASVADPDTGRSHYEGVGNNKSSITADAMAEVLQRERRAGRPGEPGAPGAVATDRGATALSDVWTATKPAAKAGDQTVHLKITTPAGTKAEVVDSKGPVKTTLKTETTMPEYMQMSANTVDAGLGDLQPASFRGVPFGVLGGESRFGRSLAVHEYPFRDTIWPEDLGRATRRFVIQGFLVTDSLVYGGGDVIDQREQLVAAAETQGAGTLIHPTYGRLRVSIPEDGLVISERLEAGSYMEFALACYEVGERVFPSADSSLDGGLSDAAGFLDSASGSDFLQDALGAVGFSLFIGTTAIQTASAWVHLLNRAAGDVTGVFNMVSSLAGSFGRYFNGALSGYAGAVPQPLTPQTLASLVLQGTQTRQLILDDGEALVGAAGALEAQALAPAAQKCVADLVAACTNPADAVRLLPYLANFFPDLPNGPSVIGQASADMQTAMGALLRRSALAGLVRAVVAYQPQSQEDASSVRLSVCELLDAETVRAGDGGDSDSCDALANARGLVGAVMSARGARLPPVRQFDFARSLPALVLAQRIYQDFTRADQLIDMAGPINPAFMPPTFKALSA